MSMQVSRQPSRNRTESVRVYRRLTRKVSARGRISLPLYRDTRRDRVGDRMDSVASIHRRTHDSRPPLGLAAHWPLQGSGIRAEWWASYGARCLSHTDRARPKAVRG